MLRKGKTLLTISVMLLLTLAQLFGAAPQEPKVKFEAPFKMGPGNVVKLADLNGDGRLDLITGIGSSSLSDRNDRYYLNNGTANPFQGVEGKIFQRSPGYTYSIVTGDINNDGYTDVVLAGGGRTQYYLNNGTADPFAGVRGSERIDGGQPYATDLADLNGDGYLDLLIDTRVYFNSGTELAYENVTPFKFYEGSSGYTKGLKAADLNGDGLLDVVMANMGGGGITSDNRYFLNNGTSEPFLGVAPHYFKVKASRTQQVEIADMNGDGLLDVVFGNDTEKISRLFLNNGSNIPFRAVLPQKLTSDTYWTWAMKTGDIDNDGDTDVVTGNSQPYVTPHDRFYLNNGSGTLFTDDTGYTYSPQPLNTRSLDLGDLNGDGYLDIVTANREYEVYIYLNCTGSTPIQVEYLLKGTVLSQDNHRPVANATVEVGGLTVKTDARGNFLFEDNFYPGTPDRLKVTCPGYAPYDKPLAPGLEHGLEMELLLLPVDTEVTIDPAREGGNIVRTADGFSVHFPQMLSISEPLIISMTAYDAATEELECAPGDFSAINSSGYEVQLISQGMLNIDITGKETGKNYSLAGHGTFTLTMPVTGDPALAPPTIPLWWYDGERGKWIEEGSAKLDPVDNAYKGTVTHFSTWNTDIELDENASLKGIIDDPSHQIGDTYRITIKAMGQEKTFYQKDFEFILNQLPVETLLILEVTNMRTGETWIRHVVIPASYIGGIYDIGTIPGPNYLPVVRKLITIKQGDNINTSWIAPEHSQLIGYEINCSSLDQTVNLNEIVTKESLTYCFKNLPKEKLYKISVKAIYTGNITSNAQYSFVRFTGKVYDTFIKLYGGSGTEFSNSIIETSDGGYITAGQSDSTDIPGTLNKGKYDGYVVKMNKNGVVQWQKMYGGSENDYIYSVRKTSDGGYILAGYTGSTNMPGIVNKGGDDGYVVKLDRNGTVQWQKLFGGSSDDYFFSAQETPDGGYILAGHSRSTDIPGALNKGGGDGYVVKLNRNGVVQWQKMYGGNLYDYFYSMKVTTDGGYILAGYSNSTDMPGTLNKGIFDCYVVKLDSNGVVQWQKMYGGSSLDNAHSITQTSDGGYIMAGDSSSIDIPSISPQVRGIGYVVKLDSNGIVQWQKRYEGRAFDIAQSIDGGYVMTGEGHNTGSQGFAECSIVKLDNNGIVEWQKMYGGGIMQSAKSIIQSSDGGYITAGFSHENNMPGVTKKGGNDMFIIKLDPLGDL